MEETIEELGRNSFRIIQPTNGFRFGMDSVLLADFAKVKKGDKVADICAGSGAISLMIAARQNECTIDAVEIDTYTAGLAQKNAALNGIENRLRVYNADIRQCVTTLGYSRYSLVVCNPPYFKGEGSSQKHLVDLTVEEIAQVASSLLRPRGRACFVFPASGLIELACALRGKQLEPKRIRCVSHDVQRPAKLALIEAVKNAHPGVEWMPVLYTGIDSPEIRNIYNL